MHTHHHGGDHVAIDVTPALNRRLAVISAVIGALVVLAMIVIGFGTDVGDDAIGTLSQDVFEAVVTDVEIGPCRGTAPADGVDCRISTIELQQGPDAGEERQLETAASSTLGELRVGDRIVVNFQPDATEGNEYSFADRERRNVLWVLAGCFAVVVIALARWRGVAAIGGLVISMTVILGFILPGILEGHDPVVVAVVGTAAIAYVALYLAHGVNALTTVALMGTLASLLLTAVLSWVFTQLAEFSGFTSDEALLLPQLAPDVDVRGLVLAGIVIGALGALDDVTVTQTASVAELHAANPTLGRRALAQAGIRIGRDHIASAVNTLALAYAGAALPLLLLFEISGQSLGAVANSEVVATEIVRTLVGSIGLVAAVPVTTGLAAALVTTRRAGRASGDPAPPPDLAPDG